MFEFFRTHTRTLMFVLVPLIIGSFVFVGVDGYTKLSSGQGAKVAVAAGNTITQAQWDVAKRNYTEQIRRQAPQIDAKMFDTPEVKKQVLERLVLDRVFQAAAEKSHFSTTDEGLLQAYLTDPRFTSVRHPDGSVNKPMLETVLAQQNMTVASFEAQLRDELAIRQVTAGISQTAFAASSPSQRALDAKYQQREIQIERFETKAQRSKLQLTDAEVAEYYKDPTVAEQFKTPEQIDIEYVVLDLETLKKSVTVPDDEIRKYYEANEKRFTVPEERRSSHILFKATKSSTEAERTLARSQAERVLAEAQKTPTLFAELARKNSQESGTAERGGNTGIFFARGDSDAAYEGALFALKPGQVSSLIETPEGFYIVRLEEARWGEKRPFDAAKAEIQTELSEPLARQRITQATQEFTNAVYEQSDSLQPVADKFTLPVLSAKAVTRAGLDLQSKDPQSSTKLTQALFGNDALTQKRNTETITLKDNKLVSGRVLAHRPATLQALGEVQAKVKEQLSNIRAAELAHQDGQARLAVLRAAPSTPMGSAAQTVSRNQMAGLPKEAIDTLLSAATTSLPAVLGIDLKDQGFLVAKLNKVLTERDSTAQADSKQSHEEHTKAWARAEEKAYVEALKTRFKAKIF
jgi:peptidyl-prolyl cis-trans isomerase D